MAAVKAREEVDESFTVHMGYPPTLYMLNALEYAIRAFHSFEAYGLPREGTVKDQPVIWRLAVDCIRTATTEGLAEASAEANALAREEQEQY